MRILLTEVDSCGRHQSVLRARQGQAARVARTVQGTCFMDTIKAAGTDALRRP